MKCVFRKHARMFEQHGIFTVDAVDRRLLLHSGTQHPDSSNLRCLLHFRKAGLQEKGTRRRC